ncbi:MAG: prephenate dehydratase [Parvularculaceae bacterium]
MKKIVYQGEPGAYSHLAATRYYADYEAVARPTFEDAFAAVREGAAALAMIPIENSLAGRVADIHHLLPESGLKIVAEKFLRVNHQLMAPAGASLTSLRLALSHPMALGQCRENLRRLGLRAAPAADTAGAARLVSEAGDASQAAIASELAAKIYGLEILKSDIEDADHNVTRFVLMARELAPPPNGDIITSFVFRVRNIPAALFKCLGGFATNGVNVTKLESYQLGGAFQATQFYADLEGSPDEPAVARALDELSYFSTRFEILGVYPADPFRRSAG